MRVLQSSPRPADYERAPRRNVFSRIGQLEAEIARLGREFGIASRENAVLHERCARLERRLNALEARRKSRPKLTGFAAEWARIPRNEKLAGIRARMGRKSS